VKFFVSMVQTAQSQQLVDQAHLLPCHSFDNFQLEPTRSPIGVGKVGRGVRGIAKGSPGS
jgi:hypothetical protein